jgi:hypothetical protein
MCYMSSWLYAEAQRPIGLDNYLTYPGAVAQLGERLICTQEVAGSIPTSSTSFRETRACSSVG